MAKWGKGHGLIVPIDSLLKEKENTNRPAPLRSAGLVGRWGITKYTSIRNTSYEFESTSPKESTEDLSCSATNLANLSTQVPNPAKPKKFFKSRNTLPPPPPTPDAHRQDALLHHHVMHHQAAQLQARINQDAGGSPPYVPGGYPPSGETKSSGKKEKTKKKKQKQKSAPSELPSVDSETPPAADDTTPPKKDKKDKKEKKQKKAKKEPELPPELPKRNSSRIRNKVVNYNEDDDSYDSPVPFPDDGSPLPMSKLAGPPVELPPADESNEPVDDEPEEDDEFEEDAEDHEEVKENNSVPEPVPMPAASPASKSGSGPEERSSRVIRAEQRAEREKTAAAVAAAVVAVPPPVVVPVPLSSPSVTEHPPIVLRISKGTSRLISTDSEDVNSPPHTQQQPTSVAPVQPPPPLAPPAGASRPATTPPVAVPQVEEQPQLAVPQPLPPPTIAAPIVAVQTAPLVTIITRSPAPSPPVAATVVATPPSQPEDEPKKDDLKIKISLSKSALISNGSKSKKESKKELRHFKKRAIAREKGRASKRAKRTDDNPDQRPDEEDELKDEKLLGQVAEELRVDPIVIPTHRPQFPLPGTDAYELYRTLASPSGGDDFDSQSSILGSASSNNTPKHTGITAAEDCRIIHSRGSSDCGSDLELSQNSSTAAAPPSEINFESENTQDNKEDETAPKAAPDDRKDPPKEERVEVLKLSLKGARATRATRSSRMKNAQVEVLTKPEPVPVPIAVASPEPPVKKFGRSTRNRNNNNNVVVAAEPAATTPKKATEPMIEEDVPNREPSPPLAPLQKSTTRQYSRRKKNVIPPDYQPELLKSPDRLAESQSTTDTTTGPPPFTLSSESDSVIALTSSTSPSKASSGLDLTINNRSADHHPAPPPPTTAAVPSAPSALVPIQDENKPEPTEYKIKNKFKKSYFRSEELAKQQQMLESRPLADTPSNNTIPSAAPASTLTVPPLTIPIGAVHSQHQDQQSPQQQQQPVKLVISKKKGSIFKSRPATGSAEAADKKRHVYKHKWDDDDDDEGKEKNAMADTEAEKKTTTFEGEPSGLSRVTRLRNSGGGGGTSGAGSGSEFDDEFEFDTKLKCDRSAKPYYTVVRNVKNAHQIQEIGEFQEMDDDVEYILSALKPENPSATRCLSAMTLATKCMTPAFRMHVRAHGVVTRFFKALSDAHLDQSLGLCTATIMFVLSQDTLNMDLDRDSLELMLNLLDTDHRSGSDGTLSRGQVEKNRQKVRELCEEIKNAGKAKHMDLDNITVGSLAMESLLSLTSKRAGDWFKDELRNLGGLEHLINTVSDCCREISDYVIEWTDDLLSKLRKIERCLRVLENVTILNEENQRYILDYNSGGMVQTLAKLFKLIDSEVMLYPTTERTPKEDRGTVLREVIPPVLKIFINLSHPFNEDAYGACTLAKQPHVVETTLHLLLRMGEFVPQKFIFEMNILVLLFLINLTMYTPENRKMLMVTRAPPDDSDKVQTAVVALVEYFYRQEELARYAEKNTDAILDAKSEKNEDIQETVTKLLQKAGHHMEHTLMASYVCLLIGWIVIGNDENEATVRTYLKDNNFSMMVSCLNKYYDFLNLTANSDAPSLLHVRQTKNIIDNLKRLDAATGQQQQPSTSGGGSGSASSSATAPHRYGSRSSTRAHY